MNYTAQSVWGNCLNFIKDNIQPQAYKTWFEPIVAVKLADQSLSIQVPSKFFYEWLEEHYVKILKVALTKELGEDAKLVYIIKMENTYGNKQPFTEKIPSSNRSAIKSQRADIPLKNKNPELKNPFIIPGIRNIKIESQLNPTYTFENFLEGDSNRLARNAGIAEEIINAIHTNTNIEVLSQDQQLIYTYARELLTDKRVSSDTYANASKRFSTKELVDLTTTIGYYSMIASVLNAFEV